MWHAVQIGVNTSSWIDANVGSSTASPGSSLPPPPPPEPPPGGGWFPPPEPPPPLAPPEPEPHPAASASRAAERSVARHDLAAKPERCRSLDRRMSHALPELDRRMRAPGRGEGSIRCRRRRVDVDLTA